MRKYDTIFLDRDGTLNYDPGYISKIEDFKYFENTILALKLLKKVTGRFCIITNQSGISRGLIKPENLEKIHNYILETFSVNKLPLCGIYVCNDHPDKATNRRKPGIGMFKEAAAENQIDLKRSLIIGDSSSDMEPGIKLGMETMLVLTGNGKKTLQDDNLKNKITYVVSDLLAGAKIINGKWNK